MVVWHHRLNGYEFEHTLVDDEGQGSLACYSPWGHKELDTTQWLNNNNKYREKQDAGIYVLEQTRANTIKTSKS